jgi:hypothetical protein
MTGLSPYRAAAFTVHGERVTPWEPYDLREGCTLLLARRRERVHVTEVRVTFLGQPFLISTIRPGGVCVTGGDSIMVTAPETT